jgi:hypothetical protein
MTQDEIVRMVQFCFPSHREMWCVDGHLPRLERFAKLVAQHEREACAKVCEDSVEYAGDTLAEAIRARGQAKEKNT